MTRYTTNQSALGPYPLQSDLTPFLTNLTRGEHRLPIGQYTLSEPLVIPAGCHVIGGGSATQWDKAATMIRCAKGGAILDGDGAQLTGVYLLHSANFPDSDGVQVRAPRCSVTNVAARGFARDGFSIESDVSQRNCNLAKIERCRAEGNGRHGFYVLGSDSNLCVLELTDAVSNGGYGYYNSSAKGTYLNPHAANNTGGGYLDDGIGNKYINPYAESGVGFTAKMTNSSYYGIWMGDAYGSPAPDFFEYAGRKDYPGGGWIVFHNGHYLGVTRMRDGRLWVEDNAGKTWRIRINPDGSLYTTQVPNDAWLPFYGP